MKIFPAGLTAFALILSIGCAAAQTSRAPAASPGKGAPGDTRAGSYWGVDTDGKRVHVQAPAGGNNRAQADRNEASVTERLNQQALQAATPPR